MGERTIYVTDFDLKRLSNLLNGTGSWNKKDKGYLTRLEEELEWAPARCWRTRNYLVARRAKR
jgi:hypothetical protein